MREEASLGRGQDSRTAASGPRCGPHPALVLNLPGEEDVGGEGVVTQSALGFSNRGRGYQTRSTLAGVELCDPNLGHLLGS